MDEIKLSKEKIDRLVANGLTQFLSKYNLHSIAEGNTYTIHGSGLFYPIELVLLYDLRKPYGVRVKGNFFSPEAEQKVRELDAILGRELNLEILKIIRKQQNLVTR